MRKAKTKLPSQKRRWGEKEGRVVIDAWRVSGLTLAEFARQHGLHEVRVQRWRKRVERSEAKRASAGLVPAVVRMPGLVSGAAPVVLRLPDGVAVELWDDGLIAPSAVAAFVAELRRSAP